MDSISKNHTWILVDLPKGAKAVNGFLRKNTYLMVLLKNIKLD
jgi:hypothetical protein